MSFDLLGSLSDGPREPQEAAASQDDTAPQCSRRGCREAAVWVLEWNNPRVHTPQRRKRWVACQDHREHLGDFLDARGFLLGIRPLEEVQAEDTGGGQSEAEAPGRTTGEQAQRQDPEARA